jgi:hypothetical protein
MRERRDKGTRGLGPSHRNFARAERENGMDKARILHAKEQTGVVFQSILVPSFLFFLLSPKLVNFMPDSFLTLRGFGY